MKEADSNPDNLGAEVLGTRDRAAHGVDAQSSRGRFHPLVQHVMTSPVKKEDEKGVRRIEQDLLFRLHALESDTVPNTQEWVAWEWVVHAHAFHSRLKDAFPVEEVGDGDMGTDNQHMD